MFLANVHLVEAWLPTLEHTLDEFNMGLTNNHFRLFYTVEEHCRVPSGLLERSIKFTGETPQGMRHNLKKSLK